jgi:hypothetical protein
MNQEQKVPSLENCQRLFDLGITKETERVWVKHENNSVWTLENKDKFKSNKLYAKNRGRIWTCTVIPAPDLSEMGELLAFARFEKGTGENNYWQHFCCDNADSEPNARAINLIELKKLEPKCLPS